MSNKSCQVAFYRKGICKFKDSADLNDNKWLKKEHAMFQHDAEKVYCKWIKLKEQYKDLHQCDLPGDVKIDSFLQEKIDRFSEKMHKTYGIQLIQPLIPEDEIKNALRYGKIDLESIDFRLRKVVYDIDNQKHRDIKMLEKCVAEVQSKLWKNNITPCLKKKHGWVPNATEISFLAYGSQLQPIHCDYVWKQGGEIYTSTPVQQSIGFFGQFLYNWPSENKNTQAHLVTWSETIVSDNEQPEIKEMQTLGGKNKNNSKSVANYYIPSGYCCLFAGHVKHGGGINLDPHIRLHVYLDPPEQSGVPKRMKGLVHIPESLTKHVKKQTLRKRKRVALQKAKYNPFKLMIKQAA